MAENPSVIFPLRCLLLGIYDPETFEEIVKLEAHLEERRDTAIWRRHRISVEDVLKETNLITQKDVEEELVQKICGILDVNSFEVSFIVFVLHFFSNNRFLRFIGHNKIDSSTLPLDCDESGAK